MLVTGSDTGGRAGNGSGGGTEARPHGSVELCVGWGGGGGLRWNRNPT